MTITDPGDFDPETLHAVADTGLVGRVFGIDRHKGSGGPRFSGS